MTTEKANTPENFANVAMLAAAEHLRISAQREDCKLDKHFLLKQSEALVQAVQEKELIRKKIEACFEAWIAAETQAGTSTGNAK